VTSYVWNGEGLLKSARRTTYTYDGDDKRVAKSSEAVKQLRQGRVVVSLSFARWSGARSGILGRWHRITSLFWCGLRALTGFIP
jgi:hypothetical protein